RQRDRAEREDSAPHVATPSVTRPYGRRGGGAGPEVTRPSRQVRLIRSTNQPSGRSDYYRANDPLDRISRYTASACSNPTNGDSSSSNGTTSSTRKCWLWPAMISSGDP